MGIVVRKKGVAVLFELQRRVPRRAIVAGSLGGGEVVGFLVSLGMVRRTDGKRSTVQEAEPI